MPRESARMTSPNNIAAAIYNRTNGERNMAVFEIEQYELFIQRYQVEATNQAEAVEKLLAGEADPVDNSTEYIEVADNYGLPVDQNRDLAEQLRERGIAVGEDIIPSLRSIEEVE